MCSKLTRHIKSYNFPFCPLAVTCALQKSLEIRLSTRYSGRDDLPFHPISSKPYHYCKNAEETPGLEIRGRLKTITKLSSASVLPLSPRRAAAAGGAEHALGTAREQGHLSWARLFKKKPKVQGKVGFGPLRGLFGVLPPIKTGRAHKTVRSERKAIHRRNWKNWI